MPSPRTKPAPAQLTLGPHTTSLTDRVLAALPSPESRRSYARAIAKLEAFAASRPLTLALLLEWRASLLKTLTPASVNVAVAAVRRLIREASRTRLLSPVDAWDLLELRGLPQRGSRSGDWMTLEQTRRMLSVPGKKDLRGLRNRAILSILARCALRVDELATLDLKIFQQREGRWVFSDLRGKGGRVRLVPVPIEAAADLQAWIKAAQITSGRIIRPLTLSPAGLSTTAIWRIVRLAAEKAGVAHVGPHDLRRTCAQLCRAAGQDIEQIQFLLGHADIRTTQRYLGTQQNLRDAPNDHLGL